MEKYGKEEILSIIKGYKRLDRDGSLSSLFNKVATCKKCIENYPHRDDHPINSLVRPIPLPRLSAQKHFYNYGIRIKRDDTFLRNLFSKAVNTDEALEMIGSAKFSIGMLPWLDRCMLHRRGRRTTMMIVGIDYKHFPVFFSNPRDHHFPLDSYYRKSNVWGGTWRRFWAHLLGKPYADEMVDNFIGQKGVYITNSMLCFGGDTSSQRHFYGYLECCREYIIEQIRIVQPEILVSFGNYGCRNVASILLNQNRETEILQMLSKSNSPLRIFEKLVLDKSCRNGLKVKYDNLPLTFWPLYQPSRSHINRYARDYETLRKLLGVNHR